MSNAKIIEYIFFSLVASAIVGYLFFRLFEKLNEVKIVLTSRNNVVPRVQGKVHIGMKTIIFDSNEGPKTEDVGKYQVKTNWVGYTYRVSVFRINNIVAVEDISFNVLPQEEIGHINKTRI